MTQTAFNVSGIDITGSVILFPQQLLTWDIAAAEDIRAHHFDILQFIKPLPSYVIIGTGAQKVFLENQVTERLKALNIKFDVLDSVSCYDQVSSSEYLQRIK